MSEPVPLEQHEPVPAARRTDKVSEVVARAIVHDIVSRGLRQGDTLPPEAVMLSRFQVGRASLREALRILEVHGLITLKPGPGGGPIVAAPTSGNFGRTATLFFQLDGATFRELVEARSLVEPVMARVAAERQPQEIIAALSANVAEGKRYQGDDRHNARLGTDFHGLMAGASGNRVLDLMGRALKELFYERVTSALWPEEDRPRIHLEHEAIVKAIERGDGRTAERLMRRHMEEMVERCEERLPGLLDEIVDWR
jgi:GntR family transcriptional regulator, transcriptional repressor for pyruvate dehydrogenase complex